jgi:hypothetical protein
MAPLSGKRVTPARGAAPVTDERLGFRWPKRLLEVASDSLDRNSGHPALRSTREHGVTR